MGLFDGGIGGFIGGAVGGVPGALFGSSGIGQNLSNSLGFTQANPQQVDPTAYQGFYQQAMNDIYNTQNQQNNDPQAQALRSGVEAQANQQLGNLNSNAAGMKNQFAKDTERSMAGQTQNMARAAGGTGTLAQAMRPSATQADANARAISSGFTDLQDKALKDLGAVSGIQSNVNNQYAQQYGQDLNKAGMSSNAQLGQEKTLLGQANTNADYRSNVENQQANRLGSTIGGIAKYAGAGGGK